MKTKNKITLSITGIVSILLITIGLSYAYFTANLTGGEDATTITVTGGTMNIVYNGGANINVANIVPKAEAFAVKTFTVTGNNTLDISMGYKISLVVETNSFSEEALKYKLISANTDNNGTPVPSINELTNIGTGGNTIELGVGSFAVPTSGNKVHTYSLELYFPNENYNQNEDQGKEFNAYVSIENYTENRLKELILAQGGGKSAIEEKGIPDFSKTSPYALFYNDPTEWITPGLLGINQTYWIGTSYTYNSENGQYTLSGTVTQGLDAGNIKAGQYTLRNSSQTATSATIYRIESYVSGAPGSTITVNKVQKSGTSFPVWSQQDSGLYATEDEYGTSYYYRGERGKLNNNLIFGGFQWKIVRINGDGSIRLLYNGTEAEFTSAGTMNTTGTNTQINGDTYTWNPNSYHNDAKYVGYMFGGNNGVASTERNGTVSTAATYNQTNSNAKATLEAWYQTNMAGKSFENKIVDNLFCNDRQLANEVGGTNSGPGYGNTGTTTYYAAYHRLDSTKTPTLRCGLKNDRYTKNDILLGNGALTHPIGLISADEAAMAGLVYNLSNSTNYLYTNQNYWTSAPYYMESLGLARVWYVGSVGRLSYNDVYYTFGLRAAINLTSNVAVSGDGSATNPYRVEI